jgi:hypothetical protein
VPKGKIKDWKHIDMNCELYHHTYLPTTYVCMFWAQNNLAKGVAKLLLLLFIFVEIVEN